MKLANIAGKMLNKNLIKKIQVLFLSLPILSTNLLAEQPIFDSLRRELGKTKNISKQIAIEYELAYNYVYINADSLRHYATHVIKKSRQIKDNNILCQAYITYSSLFNDFPEIRNQDSLWYYLDLAQETAEKNSNTKGIADCYWVKGKQLMYTKNEDRAIDYLLKAKNLFLQLGDSLSYVWADFTIAQMYELAGDYDKAIGIYERIGNSNAMKSASQYDAYLEIVGSTYQSAMKYQKSLENYKKAYSILNKKGDSHDLYRILMKLASAYNYLDNADSTNFYFNKCVSYADSCKATERMENDCVKLADICFNNKRYDEAEKYYLKSLGIVRRNSWTELELYTLERISNFYQTTKDFVKSLDYLQQYIHLKDSLKYGQIGHLLDKALTDQQLESKIAELTKLKNEEVSKSNHVIIAIVSLAIFLFHLIWYFQAGLLLNFAKTKRSGTEHFIAKSLWDYTPPSIMPGNLSSLLNALLFASLNLGFYYLFFQSQQGITTTLGWAIITLLLFYGAERLFFSYQIKRKSLPFKKELIQLLFGLAPFIVILVFAAVLLKLTDFSVERYFYFAMLITANFFITMSLDTLVQYRIRFGILSENMVVEFNKKLLDRKNNVSPQFASHQINSSNIFIDDNGKQLEINLNNLLYIVSDNVYQEFISLEGKKTTTVLVRSTMGNIEKSLADYKTFLRCHRSYIINTNRITSIIRQSRQYYFVLDKTDEKIPISRNTVSEILEKFTNYLSN